MTIEQVWAEGLRLAEALGHTLENDPPLTGFARRHSCTDCGRAVLMAHGAYHVYGSAIEKECGS
jgi:hypothetical protein